MAEDTKSGWKTTEFATTALVVLAGGSGMLGSLMVLGEKVSGMFPDSAAVALVVALVSGLWSASTTAKAYISSRTTVKTLGD